MEGYKLCSMCGEKKPLDAYYRNIDSRDGRTSKCKSCSSIVHAQYKAENREKYLERKRKYNKEHKEERLQYKRDHYSGITASMREKLNAWKRNNREKVLAHKKVYNAIKSGKLVRMPCEICGVTTAVQAHHDDYSRPLDVIWLCQKHHKWIHG